jgi:hypothetical protein
MRARCQQQKLITKRDLDAITSGFAILYRDYANCGDEVHMDPASVRVVERAFAIAWARESAEMSAPGKTTSAKPPKPAPVAALRRL